MANRLANESSPYLLQHAHNPVDWYPWGPEALDKAKRENKILIVSIGYATCHWCHVMERESFEDESIAALMNENFVNIKIDREERPDIDQVFMEVCQIINGNGGWPLNVFLRPDGKPFFAGTYYPPKSFQNRPSWRQLLSHLLGLWQEKTEMINEQAEKIDAIISKNDNDAIIKSFEIKGKGKDAVPINKIGENLKMNFDRLEGGFGGAPKFPSTMSLQFLLQYGCLADKEDSIRHTHFSIDKMIWGGIYDQIGGGFARYATDRKWLVPHFEKMLYDNALLIGLISDACRHHPQLAFQLVLEETLDWIEREMLSPTGGFYSALDADSEGEEGKYYTWSKKEIEEILGEDAVWFCEYYNVSTEGNWEGKNILYTETGLDSLAGEWKASPFKASQKLAKAKRQLLKHRQKRIAPLLDDKILTDWNCLMISGLSKMYQAFRQNDVLEVAENCWNFINEQMVSGNDLKHTYKDGQAKIDAFLDDHAFFIRAALDLFHITQDFSYLEKAETWLKITEADFNADDGIFFYFSKAGDRSFPIRKIALFDAATPSGNAMMAQNYLDLFALTGKSKYAERVERMITKVLPGIISYPSSLSFWATVCLQWYFGKKEIAIVGKDALTFHHQLLKPYLPNSVIMASEKDRPDVDLLKDRFKEDKTLIYLCEAFQCKAPLSSVDALLKAY